jgi:hypothetical protein
MVYDSRERLFGLRAMEILHAMALQFPSLAVNIDLWRPVVVSQPHGQYSDDATEVWVRLGESVPAFYIESMERWFELGVGIVIQNYNYIILPGGYNLQPSDHIILNSMSWLITESAEQAGIAKLRIDQTKSRFVMPDRAAPTYRQMGMRARIK